MPIILATLEAEIRESWFEASLSKVSETYLKQSRRMVHIYNPRLWQVEVGRLLSVASLDKKHQTLWEVSKTKKCCGCSSCGRALDEQVQGCEFKTPELPKIKTMNNFNNIVLLTSTPSNLLIHFRLDRWNGWNAFQSFNIFAIILTWIEILLEVITISNFMTHDC
jgi:hypothetical protein